MIARIVNGPYWQALPTYVWERGAVAVVLAAVAVAGGGAPVQWLAFFSFLLTFSHVQIAARLEESDDRSDAPAIECRAQLGQLLIVKETLWIVFFLATAAYPAIAGSIALALYPAWRRLYLKARETPPNPENPNE